MPPSHVRWMRRYAGGRLMPGRDGVRRGARVVDALELLAHPLAVEAERVDAGRLDERREVVEHLLRVDLDLVLDEALAAQPLQQEVGVAVGGQPHQPAQRGRQRPVGEAGHGAVVEHAQPARAAVGVRQDPEVPGVRVGVQHAGARGAGEQEPDQQLAVVVALLPGALRDDRGQRALDSIHSLTSTVSPTSTTSGTTMSGSPRKASANAAGPRPRGGSRARRPRGPGPPRPAA